MFHELFIGQCEQAVKVLLHLQLMVFAMKLYILHFRDGFLETADEAVCHLFEALHEGEGLFAVERQDRSFKFIH